MPNEEKAAVTEELRDLFHRAMRALGKGDLRSSSPCPDSESIISYVTGSASEDMRKNINVHLARCDACWEDYVALVGPEKVAELVRNATAEEPIRLPVAVRNTKEKWGQLVARAKEFVVDLGKTYGPGALIGSVKILSQVPAFAVRGAEVPTGPSTLIEVPIADNVYGINILEQPGAFVFDVAGYKMTKPVSMRIAVQLETGEELAGAETDKHGYGSLTLQRNSVPEGEFALTFALEGELWEMLFLRLPSP
jgi:hypothetical protein